MRINVNVLLGILLCVLLMAVGGTMYRMGAEKNTWRPNDIYTHLGNGASYSSVTSASSNNSDKVLVSMRGGRVLGSSRPVASAPAFSYSHASSASIANSQSPIANSSTGALYTTSSATMKSFGGGNMQNGGSTSMSGGSVRTNQSPLASNQSPIANSQLPITNSQLPIANSQSLVAPDTEALMAAAAYTPMGSSMYGIGSMPALGGTYTGIGSRLSGPRRAPGYIPGTWDAWLDGLGSGKGWVSGDAGGIRYYNLDELEKAFEEAQKNGQFPGWTWEEFLAQFFNNNEVNDRHFVPLGEPWALLILALAYVGYVFIRRTRAREV